MDLVLLSDVLLNLNQPNYRHKQISRNYFSGRFSSYLQMTDLPLSLRLELENNLSFSTFKDFKLTPKKETQKVLLTLHDGLQIESVLMDYDNWITACVSSQVGCAMNCSFCATGKMGLKRNLSFEEIIDQIVFWNQQIFPKYIGRVVFMGMGEPFANWDNLLKSINMINNKDILNIGARKISVSTCGISPKIKEFADLNTEVNLAISLHSVTQAIRETIMPIAKTYPLNGLFDACQYYVTRTKRQLFFEYVLINDINDSDLEIIKLAKFINSNKLFFLNLIPLSQTTAHLTPSSTPRIHQITSLLDKLHVAYSLRRTFGSNINAACGQLATL